MLAVAGDCRGTRGFVPLVPPEHMPRLLESLMGLFPVAKKTPLAFSRKRKRACVSQALSEEESGQDLELAVCSSQP